ncbi:DUF6211 family protein [Streptomyces sp. NPDC059193]|uniref:DUF6211 family protein n=1 Tax=Streptomyces sp. NPDC059193 TaxID=3346763 RepID=UPI0036A8CB79
MVDPTQTTHPQPYDLVRLHPGNPLGIPAGTTLIIADTVDSTIGLYEVWHLDSHPDYQDWAAAVTAADIALITRAEAGAVRTWTPAP